jgi:IPT/TIG domain
LGGGTEVTITGTRFTGATAVQFQSANAKSFTVNSDTSITAVSSAGSGTADVTVSVGSATSPTVMADQFTYVPPPTLAKISVKKGPAAGGTAVTITGTNLTGATSVNFGSVSAIPTLKSATEATVVSPPHASEVAAVTITTPGGTSAPVKKTQFKYGKPTVTNVNANHGSKAGGSVVTVTGTGFAPGAGHTTFTFGKAPGSAVTCASSTSCIVTTPAATKTGAVDVVGAVGKNKSKKSPPGDQYTYE